MTSNFGADRIQAYARSGGDFDRLKDELMDILRGSFRPEFINRIDDIIVFRALTDEQLADITQLGGGVEPGDKVRQGRRRCRRRSVDRRRRESRGADAATP